MQGIQSCEKKRKKAKKSEKLANGSAGDEENGFTEVTSDVQKNKNVKKTKLGKSKKSTKETVSKVDGGTNCSCEAGRSSKKKKKSVDNSVVKSPKVKSKKKLSDVVVTAEQHANKNSAVYMNGDVDESSFEQSKLYTQDDLVSFTPCADKKVKKRKNRDGEEVCPDFQDSLPDENRWRSKKLKTDDEDKTVISNSSVEPGAFENYRISQTMVDNLRCM